MARPESRHLCLLRNPFEDILELILYGIAAYLNIQLTLYLIDLLIFYFHRCLSYIRNFSPKYNWRACGLLINSSAHPEIRIFPSAIRYARSVIESVSRTLWSVNSIPRPFWRNSLMISCASLTTIGSMPEKGSSRRMKEGLVTKARVISSLLLSPPDRV